MVKTKKETKEKFSSHDLKTITNVKGIFLPSKYIQQQKDVYEGNFINTSDKYRIKLNDKLRFSENQYNECYATRYSQLVDYIISKVNDSDKYKEAPPLKSLSEISDGQIAFIVGIIFRRSTKRPSILDAFDDNEEEDQDIQINVDENPDIFVSDDDYFEFEDSQTQTIRLSGIPLDTYTTGMVVGLFGTKLNNNDFNVCEIILPGPPIDRIPRPTLNTDKYIVFLSGLKANTVNVNVWDKRFRLLNIRLAKYPFKGNIERLILCGNLSVDYCDCPKCSKVSLDDVKHLGGVKDHSKNQAYVKIIDSIVKQFPYQTIDIMPGNEDPASIMWPQDPINAALLKKYNPKDGDELIENDLEDYSDSEKEVVEEFGVDEPRRVKGILNAVTNPYQFELYGMRFLGTSGDNVTYLRKMTNPTRHTADVMQQMISLNHICPTAPQAPDSYPFDNKCPDPLIMDKLPHIFFAGNQDDAFSYCHKYDESIDVHFVSIPKTSVTMCVYVLNLRTMKLDLIDLSKIADNHEH